MSCIGILCAGLALGCDLVGRDGPPRLRYDIVPAAEAVRVSVTVSNGPRPVVWVGFGASPLGEGASSRSISEVSAHTVSGIALLVEPLGADAFRVEIDPDEDWVLDYRVDVGSPPADFYHRASSVSEDHMVLVGVDLWARFFSHRSAVELAPVDRPADEIEAAALRFDLSDVPDDWVVASAEQEVALNHFVLRGHPERSAFAIGPYRFEEVDNDLGIRAAVHTGWNVARRHIAGYSRQLVRTQARDFGMPPGEPSLMIFTPLPPGLRPSGGVRSSGMVWDRSLLLFAGAGPSVPLDNERIREMMAVFLGHELFHLYVPWGLPVTRPLSWLSEGWAEHVGRSSASRAGILSASGVDRSLAEAYESYRQMGGAGAGSLRQASEANDEELRPLLYMRGELVFRMLSLEWDASGKPGSFDSVLWQRLLVEYDGANPLEPDTVSRVLNGMVSPSTVRRLVDGAAVITLPELELGRR